MQSLRCQPRTHLLLLRLWDVSVSKPAKWTHNWKCLLRPGAALIGAQPLGSWKETLATLATYATNDTWQGLAQGLAERLAQHHRSARPAHPPWTGGEQVHCCLLCWKASGATSQLTCLGSVAADRRRCAWPLKSPINS